jgi:hypothetical protein
MCKWGTTVERALTISARKSHTGKAFTKIIAIDACIAPIVDALNNANIETEESCCGHGLCTGYIALMDGRILAICNSKPEWDQLRDHWLDTH